MDISISIDSFPPLHSTANWVRVIGAQMIIRHGPMRLRAPWLLFIPRSSHEYILKQHYDFKAPNREQALVVRAYRGCGRNQRRVSIRTDRWISN